MNPQAPWGRYIAGPAFHDQDENHIVSPEFLFWHILNKIFKMTT